MSPDLCPVILPKPISSAEPPKQVDAAQFRALADAIEQTMSESEHDDGMHLGPGDLETAIAALRIAADAIQRARQAGEPDPVLA